MTNDRHSGARIIEVRPVRVEDELARGRIVIVGGFQGVSYKREITTLGRGGSDTTAVALAAALGAEYCEICSDVDGVYSGDPRVVDAPRMIQAIQYDEMQELAEHGAKVMNPQAVEFARRAGIAIYARATAQAPGAEGGTRIGGPGPLRRKGVMAVGVAGMKNLTRVRVRGTACGRRLLEALAKDAVPLKRFSSDHDGATALFTRDDVPDWAAVKARIQTACGADLTSCEEALAAATVVGEGIGSDPASLSLALAAASGAGIEVTGFDGSPLRLTLYVSPTGVEDAGGPRSGSAGRGGREGSQRPMIDEVVRLLHRAFIEDTGAPA
jgi:aspartate kinase